MIREQFFGKPFWLTLAALAVVFAVSVPVFGTPAVPWVMAVIGIGLFVLTLKRLDFGLYAAVAELFANSHGHLMQTSIGGFSLSLRMIVFLAVMSAFLILLMTSKARVNASDLRIRPFLPLFAAILIGFAIGLSHNDRSSAFDDGNAYFYLAYLFPILAVDWTPARKRALLQVFAAAAVWVCLLTLGILYVFTHFPEWVLGPAYKFIRDTRTGELTKMSGAIFRIFLQAQFSAVVFGFLLAPFHFVKNLSRRSGVHLLLADTAIIATLLVSLSRSYWVGIAAGGVVFAILTIRASWSGWRATGRGLGIAFAGFLAAAAVLVLIVLFPLPYRVGSIGDLSSLFAKRTTDLSDVAVSSRWKLLDPLMTDIFASPVLGSGFGKTVTFQTDDPRVRAFSPDGTWTTYSLEWGWLELWLKMGLLGPLAFLYLLFCVTKALLPLLYREQKWVAVSLLSSVVALYAMHALSPYLNHPLGLGLLLMTVPFWKMNKTTASEAAVESERVLASTAQAAAAPLISE